MLNAQEKKAARIFARINGFAYPCLKGLMTKNILSQFSDWPKNLRAAFFSIVDIFTAAYMTTRGRAIHSKNPGMRLQGEYDDLKYRNALLESELNIQRRRIASMEPCKRPKFKPDDRMRILLLIRSQGWSLKLAAKRLIMHKNTLINWNKRFKADKDPDGFFGSAPFNKISDSVRWLVHEMYSLGIRFGDGTRTIAAYICKLGIKISRSSVQRIVREDKPKRKKKALVPPMGVEPDNILAPDYVNRTWHTDLALVKRYGRKFWVAALIDGYSRKLLSLKVYAVTPISAMMLRLVRGAIKKFGKPRFLVTDHGTQFKPWRKGELRKLIGVDHVWGQVGCPAFNGKVERFFRTFRWWERGLLVLFSFNKIKITRWLQRRMNNFRDWFNEHRPHQANGGRSPNEVWENRPRIEPKSVTVHDEQPEIAVKLKSFRNDSSLPIYNVSVRYPKAS